MTIFVQAMEGLDFSKMYHFHIHFKIHFSKLNLKMRTKWAKNEPKMATMNDPNAN